MGAIVVTGAALMCPFGTTPAALNVTSQSKCVVGGKPAATIQDCAPGVNIPGFGMCSSLANPQVASATAAALGVLTPQPCMPSPAGTWIPTQNKCLIGGKPGLAGDSSLTCAYGGCIMIQNPGQGKVIV